MQELDEIEKFTAYAGRAFTNEGNKKETEIAEGDKKELDKKKKNKKKR